MIARLRGRIAARRRRPDPRRQRGRLPRPGDAVGAPLGDGEVTVEIHTVVREDTLAALRIRDAPTSASSSSCCSASPASGPKVALAIVSGSTPAELRRAIVRDDVKRFQAIPGIGLKTAQRVVLELKEKLGPYVEPAAGRRRARRPRRARRARLVARSTPSARSPTSTSRSRSRSRCARVLRRAA